MPGHKGRFLKIKNDVRASCPFTAQPDSGDANIAGNPVRARACSKRHVATLCSARASAHPFDHHGTCFQFDVCQGLV